MRTLILALITVMFVAAGAREAVAHHSFAPFNMEAEKTISGTIKKFDWTNPHTWIWLDVAGDNGKVETWGIEGMSPHYPRRRGWTKNSLKPGDKVSIVVRPMRDGSPGGMFVRATLADGRELRQTGQAGDQPGLAGRSTPYALSPTDRPLPGWYLRQPAQLHHLREPGGPAPVRGSLARPGHGAIPA